MTQTTGLDRGRVRLAALVAILLVGCGGASSNVDASVADTGADATTDAGTATDAGTTTDAATAPTAADLEARFARCSGDVIKDGFGLDGRGSIAMATCGSAVVWTADMDVDCDGVQTPPCDTDPAGMPQTSVVDLVPGGDVDPTLVPYFVIPLGGSEAPWYTAHGIELGQVGAVIYHGQVHYGVFADEAGGWFIGEASYAMCKLFLGPPSGGVDPCSPIDGGIDPAEVQYVTFTGAASRVMGADLLDHARHVTLAEAAAARWSAEP